MFDNDILKLKRKKKLVVEIQWGKTTFSLSVFLHSFTKGGNPKD